MLGQAVGRRMIFYNTRKFVLQTTAAKKDKSFVSLGQNTKGSDSNRSRLPNVKSIQLRLTRAVTDDQEKKRARQRAELP